MQGKEIEKSENIFSSYNSGTDIPNNKNNIFQTSCICDGYLIRNERGTSSIDLLPATGRLQNTVWLDTFFPNPESEMPEIIF